MTKEMCPSHRTDVLNYALAYYGWKKVKLGTRMYVWPGQKYINFDTFIDDIRNHFKYASPKSIQESCCCN